MDDRTLEIIVKLKDDASRALKQLQDQTGSTSSEIDKNGGIFEKYGGRMKAAAAAAVVATGIALSAAGTFAIRSAADYEQSLNIFQSVSSASAEQMTQVAARARELGSDMALPGISAKDAALAMVELSKAGISVNDTLAASKGVLARATAGQLETAEAAQITANALNAFSLNGKEATRVADLLAGAANASSADVHSMAYALQMSSSSAAAVKVPVEDLTTAIAAMANNGIQGSDAGTSLKTMFMNLIPTTKRAKESMRELNLDFYDAKGNFVGLRDMVRQLQEGTKNLTDEQKALHIENIFGSDSMRAANVLIKEGVKGYDELRLAVTKQGAATELAAAQNSGFNGALDSLKSSLETVAIDVGGRFLPMLTTVARTLASNVEPTFGSFKGIVKSVGPSLLAMASQAGNYLLPKLEDLWDAIENHLIPALRTTWKVVSPLATAMGGVLVGAVGAVIDILTVVVRVFSALAPLIMGGVAAWAAYRTIVLATTAVIAIQSALIAATGTQYLFMNGALIAVTGATNAATVAQAALNAVMSLNPVGLVIGLIAGLTGALAFLISSTDSSRNSTELLNEARRQQAERAQAATDAENKLRDAQLGVQGANLAVERATRAYNDAVNQYGSESLEARDAAYQLERANRDLERSTADFDRTQEDSLVTLQSLNSTLDALNGKRVTYSVAGSGGTTWTQNGQRFFGGSFDSGGFTGRGGEKEVAGIVHKGEYVLPKDQVDQRTGMPKATATRPSVVIYQTNNNYTQYDREMADRELGFRLAHV